MDCSKVGRLIYELRKEKNMTQLELAQRLGISDKAVSKWERGCGCPDVSLLNELSEFLGVDVQKLLSGDFSVNEDEGGNMKRLKFYVCPKCGNILTSTGDAALSCCSAKLNALCVQEHDNAHELHIDNIDGEWYITFEHEMTKKHYISFIAYSDMNKLMLVKLYPEQSPEVRFPIMRGGKLYWYCSRHGLFASK